MTAAKPKPKPKRKTYADLVRSFDHSRLAALPEYAPAVKALDALAHAINRADMQVNLEGWLDVVRDMTVSLPFHDMCSGVPAQRKAGDTGCGALTPPLGFRVKDGWVTAGYACPCGRQWTCGWSAAGPDLW